MAVSLWVSWTVASSAGRLTAVGTTRGRVPAGRAVARPALKPPATGGANAALERGSPDRTEGCLAVPASPGTSGATGMANSINPASTRTPARRPRRTRPPSARVPRRPGA
jgi:hypothetical protein